MVIKSLFDGSGLFFSDERPDYRPFSKNKSYRSSSASDNYHHINKAFNTHQLIDSLAKMRQAIGNKHENINYHMSPLYHGIPMILVYDVRKVSSSSNNPTKPSKATQQSSLLGFDDLNHQDSHMSQQYSVTLSISAIMGNNNEIIRLRPEHKLLSVIKVERSFRNLYFISLLQKGGFINPNVNSIAVRGVLTPRGEHWNRVVSETKVLLNKTSLKVDDFRELAVLYDREGDALGKTKPDGSAETKVKVLKLLALFDFVPTDLYQAHSSRTGYYTAVTLPRQYLNSHLAAEYQYSVPYMPIMPGDTGYPKPVKRMSSGEFNQLIERYQNYHPYKVAGLEIKPNDPSVNPDVTRWRYYKQKVKS